MDDSPIIIATLDPILLTDPVARCKACAYTYDMKKHFTSNGAKSTQFPDGLFRGFMIHSVRAGDDAPRHFINYMLFGERYYVHCPRCNSFRRLNERMCGCG